MMGSIANLAWIPKHLLQVKNFKKYKSWDPKARLFCFVHPIFFSSFGFWYFGYSMLPVFFHLAPLALQNVNKGYVIFSYFCNFIAKKDQKSKTKNGMNKTIVIICKNMTTIVWTYAKKVPLVKYFHLHITKPMRSA